MKPYRSGITVETKMKGYLRFAGRVTVAHVVTYVGVGALA
jgi:hypothetical protein